MAKNSDWISSILSIVRTGHALSQPQKTFSNEEFVLKTQQQIHKDFAKFNLEFPESFIFDPWTKEEIEIAIQEKLVEIMKFGETKLLQLMYTIDIPEDKFLSLTQQPDFLISISQAILKREAMKVYFRSQY